MFTAIGEQHHSKDSGDEQPGVEQRRDPESRDLQEPITVSHAREGNPLSIRSRAEMLKKISWLRTRREGALRRGGSLIGKEEGYSWPLSNEPFSLRTIKAQQAKTPRQAT